MKRVGDCPSCKCEIWLPDILFDNAIRSPEIGFYCSYGHKQHFSEAGIKKYFDALAAKAFKEAPMIPNLSNVIRLFKEKGHETQRHS